MNHLSKMRMGLKNMGSLIYMDSQMSKDNEYTKKNQRENLAQIIAKILQKLHDNLEKLYIIKEYL